MQERTRWSGRQAQAFGEADANPTPCSASAHQATSGSPQRTESRPLEPVCSGNVEERSVGTAPRSAVNVRICAGCRFRSERAVRYSFVMCMRIVSPHRVVEGNTVLGVVASASRALAVGNAEQAASRSKAADPGVCHQRVESRPADKTLSIKWEYSGQAKFTFGPCKPEHISFVSPYIASVLRMVPLPW